MIRLLTLLLAASSAAAFTSPARYQQTATRAATFISSTPSITSSSTALSALKGAELPTETKIYDRKKSGEMPKVLGGLKIGLREIVVITGASSGLGLNAAVALAKSGKYFVVMAVRDVEKAKRGKHQSLSAISVLSRQRVTQSSCSFYFGQSPRKRACLITLMLP